MRMYGNLDGFAICSSKCNVLIGNIMTPGFRGFKERRSFENLVETVEVFFLWWWSQSAFESFGCFFKHVCRIFFCVSLIVRLLCFFIGSLQRMGWLPKDAIRVFDMYIFTAHIPMKRCPFTTSSFPSFGSASLSIYLRFPMCKYPEY